MRKKIFFALFCFIIISCATIQSDKKLIQSAVFDKTNLDFIPYFFDNSENNFLKYEGDFLRIKYQDSLYVDMLCYYTNKGLFLNIESNNVDLNELKIRVISKNNGVLIKKNQLSFQDDNTKSLLFSKDFELIEKKHRVSLIKNDTIKIQLHNKEYQFLSALKSKS